MRRAAFRGAVLALVAALGAAGPLPAEEPGSPLSAEQLSVLLFVDQGRSYGYQVMMARIHLATVEAELARDAAALERDRELYARNAIPLIQFELSQLKDAWNRKQLIVAEKNLAFVAAEYEAMKLAAEHFGRGDVSVERLYATFLRGWEAGCDKGPDEVVAMKAWADFAEKALERARELHARNVAPLGTVLEREAQLKIARANYENRRDGLDRCRAVLFPTLDDVLAVGR